MRKIYTIMFFVSLALFAVSVGALAMFGLNFGVDFTGGSVSEVVFSDSRPDLDMIRNKVGEVVKGEVSVTPTGERGIIIRTLELDEDVHQNMLISLEEEFKQSGKIEEKHFDSVGPTIGKELQSKSIIAIIIVLSAIACYISFVFRKLSKTLSLWAMNLATLVGLLHDIVIPMGVFAFLGYYYGVEISAVFVAAILTILGYTVSDKVVIFDRVRENIIRGSSIRHSGSSGELAEIVHKSVMQTLVRSINNTLTVILSSAAIYFFGGESIRYFALALILGIFLGAYSSIFVASPLLVWLSDWTKKK